MISDSGLLFWGHYVYGAVQMPFYICFYPQLNVNNRKKLTITQEPGLKRGIENKKKQQQRIMTHEFYT